MTDISNASDVQLAVLRYASNKFSLDQLGDSLTPAEYGNRSRDLIYRLNNDIDYAGEFEPKTVVGDDPFDAMSHEQIFHRVDAFSPETTAESSMNWRAIGRSAYDGARVFTNALKAVNDTSWQGPAATAAVDGVRRYTTSTAQLEQSANLIANNLFEAYTGLLQTKASVPPPLPIGTADKIIDAAPDFLEGLVPGVLKGAQHAREEAEEAARQVMRTVYMPVVHQADDQVPVLPTALDPVAGGTGPDTRSGSGRPSPYGPAHDASGFAAGGRPGGDFSQVDGTGLRPHAASPSGEAAAADGPSSRDTATRASNFAPSEAQPTAATPSNSSHTSNGPGTTSGGSVLGSPVGGGSRGSGAGSRFGGGTGVGGGAGVGGGTGVGGSGPLGRGRFGSGGQPPAAGGPGTGGGAAASGGRPGAPGMGGMAPAAGRGGQGSGDDVHKTPGYLVDAVNGDELIGTLPLVVPPVLGG